MYLLAAGCTPSPDPAAQYLLANVATYHGANSAELVRAMTSVLRLGLDADVVPLLRDVATLARQRGANVPDLLAAAEYAVTDRLMDLPPAVLHAKMHRLADLVRAAAPAA